MKIELHPSSERGANKLSWLDSKFSFSFANYYNPARMGFGALRVLNDDIIAPNQGFDLHPHDNMEIITIVIEGQLEHKDSMGGHGIINNNEIQVMSAGTGIMHSEYNASTTSPLKLFQIWIESKEHDIKPRYEQKNLLEKIPVNKIISLVSGDKDSETLYIHQDAKISMGYFDTKQEVEYSLANKHGLFIMNIAGQISLGKHKLNKRDAIAISQTNQVKINVQEPSKILLIEIPI
ncbi:MAG: pirin family protein [Patescibacteria group bacterium]